MWLVINPLDFHVFWWQNQYNHDPHFTISNYETFHQVNASELLENLKEMCPWYYVHSDMLRSYTTC